MIFLEIQKLIIKATVRYLIKTMGWSFYISISIAAAAVIYLLITENRTILLPVFSAVTIFGILIFLRMFSHYFSGANREFKKLQGDSAWLTFRENGISFNSDSDSIRWKDLHKVWPTKDAFLFFTDKNSFIIRPTAGFDSEIIQFINDKVDEFRITRQ